MHLPTFNIYLFLFTRVNAAQDIGPLNFKSILLMNSIDGWVMNSSSKTQRVHQIYTTCTVGILAN